MIRQFFQSLFGWGNKGSNYPESVIKEAIERTVEGTDPWLRAVSGYKKKLRPAVIRSIDHVTTLVNGLAPPITEDFKRHGSPSALSTFFVSPSEMRNFFHSNGTLKIFLQKHRPTPKQITALLIMEKSEGIIFGAELSGDIVVKDVPQVTVNFYSHRLLEPAASEEEARRQLTQRAFDHLLTLALKKIAGAKSKKCDLERRRALLQSKLALMQREEWGFNASESDSFPSIPEIKENLKDLEGNLCELGGEDHCLDVYLNIVVSVLSHPEEYLWDSKQCLIMDQRGIKRTEPADGNCEITLHELHNVEGHQWVISLVALPAEALQNISC